MECPYFGKLPCHKCKALKDEVDELSYTPWCAELSDHKREPTATSALEPRRFLQGFVKVAVLGKDRGPGVVGLTVARRGCGIRSWVSVVASTEEWKRPTNWGVQC